MHLAPGSKPNGQEVRLNLSKGILGQTASLEKALIIRDGVVTKAFDYPHQPGQVLEIFIPSGSPSATAFLMNPNVYRSNLNQLYMLGRADKRYFEKVFDERSAARLYRVKGSNPDDP